MPKITPVNYKVLVCIFEKEGFVYSRTRGDHIIYKKKGIIRSLVIPRYKHIPVFIIKNLLRIAEIERQRYFELLRQCK